MSVLVAPLENLRSSERRSLRRLNVLTLAPFFPSVQDPVQGCFISEPLRRICEYGIESHVIAANPFYRGTGRAVEPNSDWRSYCALPGNVGLLTSGALLARAVRGRARELHRVQPLDLIHAHAALPCGEAALTIAAELNIPWVVSVHGLDVFAERQCGLWLGWAAKSLSMSVYRQATRIICISKKVCQQLPDDLRTKASVVYNGVDEKLFSPSPGPSSSFRILSVGNLIPTKDHALLLRAFAQVQKTLPHSELEIIGEGPELANLEQLARALGIHWRVTFRGRQDRQAVARAMQDCAVFALPSRYEGLGCVYLEAMACEKPVIACAGQGIAEIVQDGHNGLLVSAGDEHNLSQRLLALLQDPSMQRRLGGAARETVLKKCTLDHQACQLANVYEECVA